MKLTILLGMLASIVIYTPAISSTPANRMSSTYKVIKVHDGDTISVVNTQDNSSKKVRLACID